MKLNNKLTLQFIPVLLVLLIIQGGAIFYLFDVHFLQTNTFELSSTELLVALILSYTLSTLLIVLFVLLMIRAGIAKNFKFLIEFINDYLFSILKSDQPSPILPKENVEEFKELAKSLGFLKNSVNIHLKSMEKLAYYDRLTGLPNQEFLKQELNRMLGRSKRNQKGVAVLHLEIAEIKAANELLGHELGDQLLAGAIKRLQKLLRESDFVNYQQETDDQLSTSLLGRLQGVDFILLLSDIEEPTGVSIVAKRIIDGMTAPFQINQTEIQLNVNIGISVSPQDGSDVSSLLNKAEQAFGYIKRQHAKRFEFYTKTMGSEVAQKMAIKQQIIHALENNEFVLHFHPRVAIESQAIIGFEALIRWQSPTLGMIEPEQFLPVAEETTLICDIGNWVFDNVCQHLRQWRENGYANLRMSVNLSTLQIYRGDTFNLLKTYIELYGLSGENLEIEVTEPGVMKDEKAAIEFLHKLKQLGLTIALDDFGTSYTSLKFLQELPLDIIKVDRSFFTTGLENPSERNLLKSLFDMVKSLKLLTVASGVEQQSQVEFLREIHCDFVQGYYYSKPIKSEQVIEFLDRWTIEHRAEEKPPKKQSQPGVSF